MKERFRSMEWSSVTTAVTNLLGVMDTAVTTIVGNPFLCVFLACPVVGCALKIFRKFAKVAR